MMGFESIAQAGSERVLNSIPTGVLFAVFVWLALLIFGKPSSRTRFAVWFVAMLSIVALPFAPPLSPSHFTSSKLSAEVVMSAGWARTIFICWILIATFIAMRLAAGVWKVRRLRKNAEALEVSTLPPTIQETISRFQKIRPVAICRSADVRVPTAIGFVNPAILLPSWMLNDLPTEDLQAILLHEFAHLRRRDDWTNLAQKLVRTIFFFHPAVWWLDKRLALEREMACDELVLAETGNRHAYAECLVSLAEKSLIRRGIAMAQAMLGRAHETSLRLARILDKEVARPPVLKPVLAVFAGIVALGFVVLLRAPRLIAFQEIAPQNVISHAITTEAPILGRDQASNEDHLTSAKVLPASARTVSNRPVRIISAVAKQTRRNHDVLGRIATRTTAPAPQMLVIMQTTEYDGFGEPKVQFSVWRVSFRDSSRNGAQAELIVKSL